MSEIVAKVAAMTTEGDDAFVKSAQAKAEAQLVMRNAKAYAGEVKAKAVRMPTLGSKKRQREEAEAGDELQRVSKATSGMLKAAGEQLLKEGTEDACHMITDRFARCKATQGGTHAHEGVRDPEEPTYLFVYCTKHFKALQNRETLLAQRARVERCLACARAEDEEEVAAPFNPFASDGAAAAAPAGALVPATFAQALASNNPFLVPAQAPVSRAIVSVDDVARDIVSMDLSK